MIKFRQIVVLGLWLAAVPARADIISYLRFEEGSSWFAEDQTGLMNGSLLNFYDYSAGAGDSGPQGWSTSVASAVVPQTGADNTGSIHLAGGSAFVNLSNPNHLDLGDTFTIEFYLRVQSGSPGGFLLYGFSPVNSLYGQVNISESGDISLGNQFQDSINYVPASLVVLDEWQHYALVKQPGEYSIYIDGTLQFNGALPSGTDGPYFFFGTDISGDREIGEGFRGYIDEFRISDTALTPDQFLNAVPEPSTLVLISVGLLGVCGRRLLKTKAAGQ